MCFFPPLSALLIKPCFFSPSNIWSSCDNNCLLIYYIKGQNKRPITNNSWVEEKQNLSEENSGKLCFNRKCIVATTYSYS